MNFSEDQSKRVRGKNRLMKAVRSSSYVLIVSSLCSSSHVFASLVSDRGNIIKNSDCETKSQSDNTVGSPHGFIIHWIVISKSIKKMTKVIDVENWQIDNSRVLRLIVSLIELNCFVSSMKSSNQNTF
nr:hypothetical protein [Tanacetum cinerariifolium]